MQRVTDAERQAALNHHYGHAAGPAGLKSREVADRAVRLNPLWYLLRDFPPKLLLERRDAVWLYTVGEGGEITLGTDQITSVMEEDEYEKLLAGMQEKDPDLTEDGLLDRLDGLGHPTVAARFGRNGETVVRPARISGELRWNHETERFEIDDNSGRYWGPGVRPPADYSESERFLRNVARRMGSHFGEEIHLVYD